MTKKLQELTRLIRAHRLSNASFLFVKLGLPLLVAPGAGLALHFAAKCPLWMVYAIAGGVLLIEVTNVLTHIESSDLLGSSIGTLRDQKREGRLVLAASMYELLSGLKAPIAGASSHDGRQEAVKSMLRTLQQRFQSIVHSRLEHEEGFAAAAICVSWRAVSAFDAKSRIATFHRRASSVAPLGQLEDTHTIRVTDDDLGPGKALKTGDAQVLDRQEQPVQFQALYGKHCGYDNVLVMPISIAGPGGQFDDHLGVVEIFVKTVPHTGRTASKIDVSMAEYLADLAWFTGFIEFIVRRPTGKAKTHA